MSNNEKPKPRIVIELQEDNSLVLISFINGCQQRETLKEGILGMQIEDALFDQRQRHTDQAKRAERLAAEKADKLHKQVWQISAASRGQGVAFANRVIGPIAVNRKENPSAKNLPLVGADLL